MHILPIYVMLDYDVQSSNEEMITIFCLSFMDILLFRDNNWVKPAWKTNPTFKVCQEKEQQILVFLQVFH